MRTNHDFPVDQFIAKASALRWFDGIAADVRITVYKVGMQDTDMRPMHLCNQAMWLEPDFGVNPMGTSGVEDSIKERGRSSRCAKYAGTHAQKHDGDPRFWPLPFGKRMASGPGIRQINADIGGVRQGIHRGISKNGWQLDHLAVACAEIWLALSGENTKRERELTKSTERR